MSGLGARKKGKRSLILFSVFLFFFIIFLLLVVRKGFHVFLFLLFCFLCFLGPGARSRDADSGKGVFME